MVAFWGSRTLPRLLAHLAERPGQEVTLGELQAALGANRESLHRALQRSLAIGVVVRRKVGASYLYRTDESSPFFPEVRSLCAKMVGPALVLAEALRSAASGQVEQAFIFGSTASGSARPVSDIDVMVVGAIGDFDLMELLRAAQDRIPRTVSALAYTHDEIADSLARGDGFLLEVWAGPKVMLVGREEDLPAIPERLRR